MPKTIRNKFDKALTYENLMKAHIQSRKGKGYRKEIILFNLKQEEYIIWLKEQLEKGIYKHGGYTVFYITEPKLRRIEKSKYIDRIVHRWYVNSFMEAYFIPQFINNSYACLKGRGMHKASLDLQKGMKHCKVICGNYYILKMDVKKYFENINKDILFNILLKKIKDKKVIWLTKEILYSNEGKTGLPIGNYTSQLFANVYLNELDQYIKHKLKCKYYYRYMDDRSNTYKNKRRSKRNIGKNKNILKRNFRIRIK